MINKLVANIKKTNAPIVVGLDPMLNYIPEHVQKKAFAEFGETLEGAAEAIWQFNKEIVDKTYDLIPAVKPQIAMYEQFGIPGLVAFKKTVDYCKEKGLVVIGDIKRGDIGSTSAAYAVGHLGKVQIGSKSYSAFDGDFAVKNMLNSNLADLSSKHGNKVKWYNFHHSFSDLINPNDYFDTHPEYFSLIDGKRVKVHTELCLSNPDVFNLCLEKLRSWIINNPECDIFSVAQDEWMGHFIKMACECENCKKIDVT